MHLQWHILVVYVQQPCCKFKAACTAAFDDQSAPLLVIVRYRDWQNFQAAAPESSPALHRTCSQQLFASLILQYLSASAPEVRLDSKYSVTAWEDRKGRGATVGMTKTMTHTTTTTSMGDQLPGRPNGPLSHASRMTMTAPPTRPTSSHVLPTISCCECLAPLCHALSLTSQRCAVDGAARAHMSLPSPSTGTRRTFAGPTTPSRPQPQAQTCQWRQMHVPQLRQHSCRCATCRHQLATATSGPRLP